MVCSGANVAVFAGVGLQRYGQLRQDIKNEKFEKIGNYSFLVIRVHDNRHSRHGGCKKQ